MNTREFIISSIGHEVTLPIYPYALLRSTGASFHCFV